MWRCAVVWQRLAPPQRLSQTAAAAGSLSGALPCTSSSSSSQMCDAGCDGWMVTRSIAVVIKCCWLRHVSVLCLHIALSECVALMPSRQPCITLLFPTQHKRHGTSLVCQLAPHSVAVCHLLLHCPVCCCKNQPWTGCASPPAACTCIVCVSLCAHFSMFLSFFLFSFFVRDGSRP